MGTAVERPVEQEYRSVVSDNLRWKGVALRPGDIMVCTPPKCGTTWMQTIVTSLLFPNGDAPDAVWKLSPWVEARFEPFDEMIARLDAQTHRRVLKSHTAADGIPWSPTASYIVVGRDGRDAFMSFLNHMRNLRPDLFMQLAMSMADDGIELDGTIPPTEDVHEFFEWWLNDQPVWFEHLSSFWSHHDEPNVLFVHYADMKADLDAEMRRVAAFLGIHVDEQLWPAAVERCTFESMKQRSTEIGDFDAVFVGGADTFLYKGTNGRWHDVLTDDELAAFERRMKELLAPEAIAWTQR